MNERHVSPTIPMEEIGDLVESERIAHATITGRPPGILMHAMKIEALSRDKKVRKLSQSRSAEDEAESVAYRMPSGELYVPSDAVYGSIVTAGKAMKIGRLAASPILATIRVFPQMIGLGTEDYEVDQRSVVIQGSRIIRARPLIRKWSISFYVVYDSNLLSRDNLEIALRDAGRRVGILDFRPQHRGQFGTFLVDEFEDVKS